jgi:predicted CXXCH cytochrome family protein
MRLFLVLALLAAWPAAPAAANCMAGGCHAGIASLRYMHGPVGAEFAGAKGCEACHQSAGRACAPGRGGKWRVRKNFCGTCHGPGNASVHSRTRKRCLSCHDPHGSDKSPVFLRRPGP